MTGVPLVQTGRNLSALRCSSGSYFPQCGNGICAFLPATSQRRPWREPPRQPSLRVNRGLPVHALVKFFVKQRDEWHLCPAIRSMVGFAQINIPDAWPALPNMGLILMPRVLIYFDIEVKWEILGSVRQLLSPDGYLLLGGAESTMNLEDGFEPFPIERPVVYRLRQSMR
ncbi:MAG TPA: CheR family methyltransferase [Candidatus Acidoferrum sp.]|nr:CheR family methyltransferase [Candidatus Acidoferrum sp.]